jgi:hypothetical protein
VDLDALDNDLTMMALALYWLGFLIELELEQETPARPPQYPLAA